MSRSLRSKAQAISCIMKELDKLRGRIYDLIPKFNPQPPPYFDPRMEQIRC